MPVQFWIEVRQPTFFSFALSYGENIQSFTIINDCNDVGFLQTPFNNCSHIFLVCRLFFFFFTRNGYWILSNALYPLLMIIWFFVCLFVFSLIGKLHWFSNVKAILYPWYKPHWIMMHLLFTYCWTEELKFVKNFCI